MINASIHKALDRAFASFATTAGIPGSRISWSNKYFDASAKGDSRAGNAWYRATMLPGEPDILTLGAGGYLRLAGVYQIDCFFPKGTGGTAAEAMADKIANNFNRSCLATFGAVGVTFPKAWATQGQEESSWFHVPVTINYVAYATA